MEPTRWNVEWVPRERLSRNPANPRQNQAAVPHVAASLRRFGWQQPIVARADGVLVAGDTRLQAAAALGMAEVPVVWFTGSELEAVAYGIADNRTHEFSAWDQAALGGLLRQLQAEDGLEGVGYSTAELDALLRELEGPAGPLEDPGPEPPPAKPVTRPGDLWILGEHRLLCGDSTKPEDLARVMGDDVAELLATDPPYCVDYTGNDRPHGGKDWGEAGKWDHGDLAELLRLTLAAALPRCAPNAAVYVWHAHRQQPTVAAAFEAAGLLLHQVLVWVKPAATFGHSVYRWRHEPCAMGWRQGSPPAARRAHYDTVWECDWDGIARPDGIEHPTSKPTRLFEIPMEVHTAAGAIVLEPFSGSGSQLVAAERLRRRCRAIEISPAFVDVALRRWQGAAGKAAILEGDGRAYEELQVVRA